MIEWTKSIVVFVGACCGAFLMESASGFPTLLVVDDAARVASFDITNYPAYVLGVLLLVGSLTGCLWFARRTGK